MTDKKDQINKIKEDLIDKLTEKAALNRKIITEKSKLFFKSYENK